MTELFLARRALPEFCYSERDIPFDGLVLHYISVDVGNPDLVPWLEEWQRFDVDTVYNFLVELNMPGDQRGAVFKRSDYSRAYGSYHYLIARDGSIYLLVPEGKRAYHAGASEWLGRDDCNSWTASAALIGPGEDGYTMDQYVAAANLSKYLASNFGTPRQHVTGHENVAVPEGRKHDPGPHWDWDQFKRIAGR